ncbi:MAG TPA: DUF6049 family protein [Mycobacteriales bacterium]|nr:DUF6049 family protein [Mycobacteriales bacterium]
MRTTGRRSGPARSRPRALATTAALLAAGLLAGLPFVVGAAPTPAAASSEPDRPRGLDRSEPLDTGPVRVEVATLLPRAPTDADQVLQITGEVVNEGAEELEDVSVRLAVGSVVRSRSALALADTTRAPGRPRTATTTPVVERLGAGRSAPFDLRVRVGELRLRSLGVHPVQLQVRGRTPDGGGTTTVGSASTFVPWFPGGPPAPSRLAFLWPLVDVPARAPDGALLTDELAGSLADDGRLGALLTAAREGARGGCDPEPARLAGTAAVAPAPGSAPGSARPCRRDPVPLTFGVDPALLEAVSVLASPHTVVTAGGTRRDQGPSEAARAWLDELRAALDEQPADGRGPTAPAGDLLALPYADPDVAALARAPSELVDDVEQLRLLGRRTAADVAETDPLEDVAWPPPGPVTSAALDASLGGGATAVVLDEAALPPAAGQAGRTPGARTTLSSASAGRVTGLVVDEGMSRLLAASPEDPGWQGDRLAEQRWIAETAIVAAERPGESRTFVVAPPRRGTVSAEVGAEALRDAGRLPWLCPVRLADVAAGTERCPRERREDAEPVDEDRGDLDGADAADEPELLPSPFLADVAEVRDLSRQLTDDVLVPGSDAAAAVKARFLQARGRAESSAWRDRPETRRRMLDLLRDDVMEYRGSVQIRTSGRQLLTSDNGVIEITVTNALDQPVTVGVQLNDPVEARLTSTDTDVRTIGPQEVVVVRLSAQVRTSGQFVVRATLLDRTGRPFGEPAELIVRSTQFARLALGITGVATGVLLVAAGVRIVRRAVRRPVDVFLDDE